VVSTQDHVVPPDAFWGEKQSIPNRFASSPKFMKDKCYKYFCEMASENKLGVKPFADEFDQFPIYQFSSLRFQISSDFDQSSSEVNSRENHSTF
jgi:hypothetical protein